MIDYSSNPEDADVRADFDGDRLREWLDSDHGVRQKDENGKPRGVRWSEQQAETTGLLLTSSQCT